MKKKSKTPKTLLKAADTNPGDPNNPELETKAVMAYFKKNQPIAGAIDIHTADRCIYYPTSECLL